MMSENKAEELRQESTVDKRSGNGRQVACVAS